ncbi:transporter [Paraburkholderia sp. USG1]|uniref:SphA family protein n=1 Tax=Paraburkholderia sp. USG1 TaxID=2952268 RepID=UPI002865B927|nr:transporter [Paraburkholderia sp. USG1]MDR8394713.1 transporter [Paraburkholderia sp. USG1]
MLYASNGKKSTAGQTTPRTLKKNGALALSSLLLCLTVNASAAEGITYGGPRGGTDIGGAYLPPVSGFYGIALGWGATANGYYGNNARSDSAVKFDGTPIVGGLGLLYVYPFKLAGGTLASSVLETYALVARLCLNNVCKNQNGFGDLYSDILMWSKYLGTGGAANNLPYGLTVKAAMSMSFPTGKYRADSPVPNFGSNLYRIIPNFALTYLTGPNVLGDGVEISTQFFYGVTPTNDATQYKSGDTIDIDFAVSQRSGRWQYGIAGNYAVQLNDDKLNGTVVPGGDRLGLVTLGPVVSYEIPSWKSVVKAKLQLPVYTRNTAHQSALLVTLVKAF